MTEIGEVSDEIESKIDEKEMLKLALDSLPAKIKVKEELILSKTRDADRLELENKVTESSFLNQVRNELDEEKKKKFKNEIERKNEADKRLKDNAVYVENQSKISELRKEAKDSEIVCSYLKRRFRGAESIARLGE